MPYQPADFSGLMADYTRMYALRMNHDIQNRTIEAEDADRAIQGLNHMETIYTDFVNKGEAANKSQAQIDAEFTQKYPGLISQAQEYFKKYAAPAWAKQGETDDDSIINIVKSFVNPDKFMLTGQKNGKTVPKTVDGSSNPESRMVELSPLELLRNTRYNIALKYGKNPFSDTQTAAKAQGLDLDKGTSLNEQLEAQKKAAAQAAAAAQGNQSRQTVAGDPNIGAGLGDLTVTPSAGDANVGSTTTGVDPQSGKPSASLSGQAGGQDGGEADGQIGGQPSGTYIPSNNGHTDTLGDFSGYGDIEGQPGGKTGGIPSNTGYTETLGDLATFGELPSGTEGGMSASGEVGYQNMGSTVANGNRGVIGDPADPATQAAQAQQALGKQPKPRRVNYEPTNNTGGMASSQYMAAQGANRPQGAYHNIGTAGSGRPDRVPAQAPSSASNVNDFVEGSNAPTPSGPARKVAQGGDLTPEEVNRNWTRDIARMEEQASRSAKSSQQAMDAGDEGAAGVAKRKSEYLANQAQRMKSAQERGLSRDEYKLETKLIKASQKGIIPDPNQVASDYRGTSKAEQMQQALIKKNQYKRESHPEAADAMVKDVVATGANKQELNDNVDAFAAASGPESLQKTVVETGNEWGITNADSTRKKKLKARTKASTAAGGTLKTPTIPKPPVNKTAQIQDLQSISDVDKTGGVSHAGTQASLASPAQRIVFAAMAKASGHFPSDEAGMNGMLTFIQTGRLPADIAAHYKNQQAYMSAAHSYQNALTLQNIDARAAQMQPYKIASEIQQARQRHAAGSKDYAAANETNTLLPGKVRQQGAVFHKTNAETGKLGAETVKIGADTVKVFADTNKVYAETDEIKTLLPGKKRQQDATYNKTNAETGKIYAETTGQDLANQKEIGLYPIVKGQAQADLNNTLQAGARENLEHLQEQRLVYEGQVNSHLEQSKGMFVATAENRGALWTTDIFDTEITEQRWNNSKAHTLRVMSDPAMQKIILQAAFKMDPSNPQLFELNRKLTRGLPLSDHDRQSLLTYSNQYGNAVATFIQGHALFMTDVTTFDNSVAAGTGLIEFLKHGPDLVTSSMEISGFGDRAAYKKLYKMLQDRSGMDPKQYDLLIDGLRQGFKGFGANMENRYNAVNAARQQANEKVNNEHAASQILN